MNPSTYQTPDLASVLRTLAAYTSAPSRAPSEPEKTGPYQAEGQGDDDGLEDGEYDPAATSYQIFHPFTPQQQQDPLRTSPSNDYGGFMSSATPIFAQGNPTIPAQEPSRLQRTQLQFRHQPAVATGTAPATQTYRPPQHPAATIITWAPALRRITTVASTNQEFAERISHLIKTQHQHERQWWAAREELTKRVHGRAASRSKLDSVLSSLGGKTAPLNQPDLPPKEEMEKYDKKVYRACQDMTVATTKELAKLEVPFFCTKKGLICGKGEERREGTITEQELVALQKRMLELLEDMCGGKD